MFHFLEKSNLLEYDKTSRVSAFLNSIKYCSLRCVIYQLDTLLIYSNVNFNLLTLYGSPNMRITLLKITVLFEDVQDRQDLLTYINSCQNPLCANMSDPKNHQYPW